MSGRPLVDVLRKKEVCPDRCLNTTKFLQTDDELFETDDAKLTVVQIGDWNSFTSLLAQRIHEKLENIFAFGIFIKCLLLHLRFELYAHKNKNPKIAVKKRSQLMIAFVKFVSLLVGEKTNPRGEIRCNIFYQIRSSNFLFVLGSLVFKTLRISANMTRTWLRL